MKHFSAPFPASTPLPRSRMAAMLMKLQIILRGLSEWLVWAPEGDEIRHTAAPCAGDGIRGSHYLQKGM